MSNQDLIDFINVQIAKTDADIVLCNDLKVQMDLDISAMEANIVLYNAEKDNADIKILSLEVDKADYQAIIQILEA